MKKVMKAASKFQRQIRLRNFIEYAAGGVVMVWTLHSALFVPAPLLVKAGSVLLALGALVVVTVLRKRGHAAGDPPFSAATSELVAWHRSELARQRDLLYRVPVWYLGPLLPGMLAIVVGRWLERPDRVRDVAIAMAIIAVAFGATAALNWAAARKLDRKLRDLEQGLLG
jgi:hypothetical protein